MRVLCVSAQLAGHLDWGGYTRTALALQSRGHDLLWVSGREVMPQLQKMGLATEAIEQTGWRWPPPPPLRPSPGESPETTLAHRQRRSLDQWLDVDRVRAASRELLAVIERYRPDLVMAEMFMASAGIGAEMAAVPLVVLGWPAPPRRAPTPDQSVVVTEARTRLNRLLAEASLQGVNWTESGLPALRSPRLHLTFWNERWFGAEAIAPTRHVGGIAPTSALEPAMPDAPWVLITLGTSFNNDPNFFLAAASAAHEMGCIPQIVVGRSLNDGDILTWRQRLPASAQLHTLLDLNQALPRISVAIHHGGAGTTHSLVTHAVPQIVVPHAADQHRQARGVARTQVGFHIAPHQATVDNLVQALATLLPDRSDYRQSAVRLKDEFAALGGVETAADLIEQCMQ